MDKNINVVNFENKFSLLLKAWDPKVIGEANNCYVKVARFDGEYVWHHHDNEDEMFICMKGQLIIKLRNKDLKLNPGEMVVIPRGIEHLPKADIPTDVVIITSVDQINTGNVVNEYTKTNVDWI